MYGRRMELKLYCVAQTPAEREHRGHMPRNVLQVFFRDTDSYLDYQDSCTSPSGGTGHTCAGRRRLGLISDPTLPPVPL